MLEFQVSYRIQTSPEYTANPKLLVQLLLSVVLQPFYNKFCLPFSSTLIASDFSLQNCKLNTIYDRIFCKSSFPAFSNLVQDNFFVPQVYKFVFKLKGFTDYSGSLTISQSLYKNLSYLVFARNPIYNNYSDNKRNEGHDFSETAIEQ